MPAQRHALALDPLVRRILSRGVLHSIRLTVFADDMALAVECLRRQLGEILRLFMDCAGALGLRLRGDKCVFIPTRTLRDKAKECAVELQRHDASAMFRTAAHATYLGFEVGPGAVGAQWDTVTVKVAKRVEEVLFPPSMAARLVLYSTSSVCLCIRRSSPQSVAPPRMQ